MLLSPRKTLVLESLNEKCAGRSTFGSGLVWTQTPTRLNMLEAHMSSFRHLALSCLLRLLIIRAPGFPAAVPIRVQGLPPSAPSSRRGPSFFTGSGGGGIISWSASSLPRGPGTHGISIGPKEYIEIYIYIYIYIYILGCCRSPSKKFNLLLVKRQKS